MPTDPSDAPPSAFRDTPPPAPAAAPLPAPPAAESKDRLSSLAMPLALLFVGGVALAWLMGTYSGYARAFSAVELRPVTPRGDLAADEQATIELFERCSPSVVYISPLERVRVYDTPWSSTEEDVLAGTGSGFIWDREGHIVTNYHVVAGASGALVTLKDNTTYEATEIVIHEDKDLAVITIDAPPEALAPLALGTAADLRVGQKVFAIGSPYELDYTLTHGIISALDREIDALNGRTIQEIIQIDAAINPGNSGGPLLDSAGRLIGVNTMIYSESGSSAGIGFAVPVDVVNRVVTQLVARGHVVRPGLGITLARDDEPWRRGLPGVPVRTVTRGGAADVAGLRGASPGLNGRLAPGDLILAVNDAQTPDAPTLLNTLEKHEVGETVTLTLEREGETVTLPVTLQAVE